jgi:hypothetical protein
MFLQGLKERAKNLDNPCPARISNQEPADYKSEHYQLNHLARVNLFNKSLNEFTKFTQYFKIKYADSET